MKNDLSEVRRVLWIILFLNLLVSALKVLLGLFTVSQSMLADGFHSLTDGSSNVVGLIGLAFAMQPTDRDHPYGHKKFETFSTLGIAMLLILVVVGILHGTYERILNPIVPQVNWISFAVMLLTLVINFYVVKYELREGKRLQSDLLISDAYHTQSDIYVSLSVIVSLIAVKLGLIWVDTVAAIVIAVVISRAIWEIVKHSSMVLCDQAVLDEDLVGSIVMGVPGVLGCHKIRSRGREDDLNLDLHVLVSPTLTVEEAHEIADAVEAKVKTEIQGVSDIVVHIEPAE